MYPIFYAFEYKKKKEKIYMNLLTKNNIKDLIDSTISSILYL